jgi:ubiquinone/menaquinone biosynthesis C-methylase UbiE
MKRDLLEVLHCPRCGSSFRIDVLEESPKEIVTGFLECSGLWPHRYEIRRGVVCVAEGFDHASVKREIEYLDGTYGGDARLTDPGIIGDFPDSLPLLWPGTANFGPDFRNLIDLLPPISSRTWILDVGTAACWTSRLLSEQGGRVIALDVSESDHYGLNAADIQFEAHDVYFERILESMTHLPFRNDSIDCITFNASLHHTPDLDRTLAECYRTLKLGGVIGMVNESMVSLRHRFFPHENHSDTGSHHDVSYGDFEVAARRAGFSVRYYLAQHVKDRVQTTFLAPLGGLFEATLERFPTLLKQLNSAVVILNKAAASRPLLAGPMLEVLKPAVGIIDPKGARG